MKKLLVPTVVLMAALWTTSASACCSYGCCDCSCVSLKLEKLAPKLSKQTKGGLQSFTVDTEAKAKGAASWKCQMDQKIASCSKQ